MVLVVAVLVVNFLVDLLYVVIDPRLRVGQSMSTLPELGPARDAQPEPARRAAAASPTARREAGRRRRARARDRADGAGVVRLDAVRPDLVDPADRLQGLVVADTGSAPTSSAATCSPGSWWGRGPRCSSASSRSAIAAVIGVPLGIVAGDGAAAGRRGADAGQRPAARVPGAAAGDHVRRGLRRASTLVAMVAIGIATIPSFARLVRSGHAAGDAAPSTSWRPGRPAGGRSRSALRHVLPNVGRLVIVQASVGVRDRGARRGGAVVPRLGTPPPTPSWGRMLQESQELLFIAPRCSRVPGPGDRGRGARVQPARRRAARPLRPQAGGPPMSALPRRAAAGRGHRRPRRWVSVVNDHATARGRRVVLASAGASGSA